MQPFQRFFLLGAWILSGMGISEGQKTAAQWIWFPEQPATDCIRETRWLRKSFTLPAVPQRARLWLLVDDSHKIWINGQGPLEPEAKGRAWLRYEVGPVLREGRNVLAVEAMNATGPAGLLARLIVYLADGKEMIIVSDDSWRATKTEPPGDWIEDRYDDSAWPVVRVMGSAFSAPWHNHPLFDVSPFITTEEQAAYEQFKASLLAPPEPFARERPASAAIHFHNGASVLFINGRPRPLVMYRATLDPLSAYGRHLIASFRDAGIHVYAPYVALSTCWHGPGQYDWQTIDEQLRAYLSVDKEAYLVVLVRLVPPDWWMQAHPDEMIRYATSEKIDGADEAERVLRPSLASEAWRKDVGAAWTALIQHIEAQPWGKRVIGWHACYGIYAEWHYFGSWTNQYPDVGPAMTKAFRAYLRERYKTDAQLQAAWNDPEATLARAVVPGVEPRRNATWGALRNPQREQCVIDYYRCQQKITADAVEYFGRLAKAATKGRALYGVYYGYFWGVPPQTQGGHLELLRLLKSPYVDYFVAPYDYEHRLMGMDGRLRSPACAFSLAGKAHIIEADIRTHLHPREEHGRVANLTESLAAIRREFSTSLIEHTGYWFVDFGPEGMGGWMDDPEIMRCVAALYRLAERALQKPRRSVTEIALVCDLDSAYYLSDGEGMQIAYKLISNTTTELYHTGTPFEALLLPQLTQADLSRYKAIVFLNTIALNEAQAVFIHKLREAGKHAFIFLWAPGVTGPEGISLRRVELLTGFPVMEAAERASGRVIITQPEHQFVKEVPVTQRLGLDVASAMPIAGFDVADNWHNPRTPRYMEEHYQQFDWQPIPQGMRWKLETIDSWSDIHWQGEIPEATGLGLSVRVTSHMPALMLHCVIKDANAAEFVSPLEALTASRWRELHYPFEAFQNAPWAKEKPAKPCFPLKGMKFVLYGVNGAGPVTLEMKQLCALTGRVVRRLERTFGEGKFGPLVAPQPSPDVEILGHIDGCEESTLAVKRQGRQFVLYCPAPYLPREIFRAVFKEAGVHFYTEEPSDVVRVDSQFIAIHTKAGGPRRLHLPVKASIRDALTGAAIGRGKDIHILLPPNSTAIYEWRPE